MAEPPTKRTTRDLLQIVRRRQRLFLLTAAAVGLSCLVLWHFAELKYTGTTRFRRRLDEAARASRANASMFEQLKLGLEQDLAGRTAVEIVVTDLGLDRGPQFERNEDGELTLKGKMAKQQLVKKLMESISIAWGGESRDYDEIAVSVTHSDPNLAQQLPNALVKNYIDRVSKKEVDRLQQSKSFLDERVILCENRLKTLESERVTFEIEHAKAMPESPGAVQHRIDQVEADILRLRREAQAAELRRLNSQKKIERMIEAYPALARLAQAGAEPTSRPAGAAERGPATRPAGPAAPPAVASGAPGGAATSRPTSQPAEPVPLEIHKAPNPERRRLEALLAQEQEQLDTARLVAHMKDTHPKVKAILAKIERLKKQIEQTPEEIVVRKVFPGAPLASVGAPTAEARPSLEPMIIVAYQDADYDLRAAQQELERIASDIAPLEKRRDELKALMDNLGTTQKRYAEICQRVAECTKELEEWRNRRAEVNQALAAEVAKRRTLHEVTQAAEQQFLPSSPTPTKVLASSVGLSLAVAAGLIYLLNLIDRRINTKDEAREYANEYLGGIEVHGVIGEIMTTRRLRWERTRRWLLEPPVWVLVTASVVVAAFSIVLKLRFPNSFQQWSAQPLLFINQNIGSVLERISGLL